MPANVNATIELWVIVDESGNAASGTSQEEALSRYGDDIGEVDGPIRFVKVTLTVPLPKPVELAATVAEESMSGTVIAV